MVKKIVLSSGHSKFVSGANKYISEVTEARRVSDKIGSYLKQLGVGVDVFHDDTSKSKNENLSTIVKFHNSKERDLDVSIHFNACKDTDKPVGTEVYGYNNSAKELGSKLSLAIANASGLKNRGYKVNSSFYFLKNTKKTALLVEVCFVDSKVDVELYKTNFDKICLAIAETIAGKKLVIEPPTVTKPKVDFVAGTYQRDVVVSASVLNIRAGRGTVYPVIGQFKSGDKVNIWYIDKDKNGDMWGSCGYNGKTGYVHMGYVNPS